MDALRGDTELWSRLREVEAREAPRGDIQAAHSPQLYKLVEKVVSEGTGYLDARHSRLDAFARRCEDAQPVRRARRSI